MSTPKLSKPGKIPCLSWSLQAIDTCPGAWQPTREPGAPRALVDACRGCYAQEGNYHLPAVKAVRAHNREDWREPSWESAMVRALSNERWFRWFDSGDCYHVDLAHKIKNVIKRTPWCSHWLPTRSHKFPKIKQVFQDINRLNNAIVRYSSDGISGQRVTGAYTSTIIAHARHTTQAAGAKICQAYAREGKCGDCRLCWDRSVPCIAYPQHGRKMQTTNRDIIARGA